MVSKQISLIANLVSRPGRNEIEIIGEIQDYRNMILKQLLNRENLQEYIFLHFRIQNLKPSRLEAIKAVIVTMIMSPLDLNRYCRLIKSFICQDQTSFSDSTELFFHEEIEGKLWEHVK
jgi:hypothetical protein